MDATPSLNQSLTRKHFCLLAWPTVKKSIKIKKKMKTFTCLHAKMHKNTCCLLVLSFSVSRGIEEYNPFNIDALLYTKSPDTLSKKSKKSKSSTYKANQSNVLDKCINCSIEMHPRQKSTFLHSGLMQTG